VLVEDFECFSVRPVNDFNFYRWHTVSNLGFPLTAPMQNCFCLLNGNNCANFAELVAPIFSDQYRRGGGGNKYSKIQQVAFRRCSFYMNFREGEQSPTRTPKLVLTDGLNVIVDLGFILNVLPYTDGSNRFDLWADFDFPDVPNGEYMFALTSSNSEQIFFIGNPMEVVSDLTQVTQVKYRNETEIYKYRYQWLPDFFTTLFLRLTVTATAYEDDEEAYKEVSTRKHLTYQSQADRVYTFETYWFDQNQHEAMATMGKHDEVNFNTIVLQQTGAYSQETTKGGNLSIGSVSYYDQEFAEANNNC